MRYAGLIQNDIVDSVDGFAVSFWVQGCPFHCKGCHNPHTWDFDGGFELPSDYYATIKEFLSANDLQRNLSILGGEPLCAENLKLVNDIVSKARNDFPSIKILVWTGYLWERLLGENNALIKNILGKIDILIDGQFVQELKDVTLPLRGSSNQRVIDVRKSLVENKIINYTVVDNSIIGLS